MFDTIELISRSSGHEKATLPAILVLALYKLPDVGQQILPFIILFAGIATLWSLTQRRELVCLRSAGLSVWQFLTPIMIATMAIGLLHICIIHPISAASLARFGTLERYYFDDENETVSIIDEGLWLRQSDPTGSFILKADTLNVQTWGMDNVSVFFFDANNLHTRRIDADSAILLPDRWIFNTVRVQAIDGAVRILPQLSLATSLTRQNVAESFSNPETISFWRLPYFIQALENTGLDTTEMKIYYQSILVQPLMLIAMICIAGAVALRTSRFVKLLPVVAMGMAAGFIVFFFASFLRALGAGQEIPVILAIWTPPIIIILCASATLIQLEDG